MQHPGFQDDDDEREREKRETRARGGFYDERESGV